MPIRPLRLAGPKARIAIIPGDGIGREVTPVAVQVIKAATSKRNRPIEFVEFDLFDRALAQREGRALQALGADGGVGVGVVGGGFGLARPLQAAAAGGAAGWPTALARERYGS